MKYIRVRVKNLHLVSDELLYQLSGQTFDLQVSIPLPDIYQKKISELTVKHEVFNFSENDATINSLNLQNFRVDEETLGQYVTSVMRFTIDEYKVEGLLNMNKLIMAHDFKLEETV